MTIETSGRIFRSGKYAAALEGFVGGQIYGTSAERPCEYHVAN
jgi:hypothetical protein